MKVLLDTHILIWHLTDNPKLPIEKSKIIEDTNNTIFFSVAGLWEIGIKKSIGKLKIAQPILSLIPNPIIILDIKPDHIQKITELPFHHRDPFDRMIIAQAQIENLILMSYDQNFKFYDVKLL